MGIKKILNDCMKKVPGRDYSRETGRVDLTVVVLECYEIKRSMINKNTDILYIYVCVYVYIY